MRDVPADLIGQMRPMPEDFTVAMDIAPNGQVLKWEGTLCIDDAQVPCEYGMNLPASPVGPAAMQIIADSVRRTVWQAQELARLGRGDLLHYIRKDRHTNRPGKGAQLSPEAQSLLKSLKDAHEARMAAQTQV